MLDAIITATLLAGSFGLALLIGQRVYRSLASQTVSATGLAVFRIWFGVSVLAEIGMLFDYRHLIYDPIPYLEYSELNPAPLLLAWGVVASLLTLGAWTRPAAIANYVLSVIVLSSLRDFEYHYDYIIISTSLLFIWAPISETLSVDRLRWRLRERPGEPDPAPQIPRLWPMLILFMSLASMYFVSAIHKVESEFWREGLGLWMPATLPLSAWLTPTFLLDYPGIMKAMSHIVLVFEYVFVFALWSRRLWLPLAILGVGFHVGIAIFFPIPIFALGVTGFFVLLVPDGIWTRLGRRCRRLQGPRRLVALLASSALLTRLARWIDTRLPHPHFDTAGPRPNRRLLATLAGTVGVVSVLNLIVITQVAEVKQWLSKGTTAPVSRSLSHAEPVLGAARVLSGIGFHDIFADAMFLGYNHQVTLAYVRPDGSSQLLPIMTERGRPIVSGRVFRGWMFGTVGPTVDHDKLIDGISRFSADWAQRNGVPLQGATFRVLVKRIEIPEHWEAGLLPAQESRPWESIGHVRWHDGRLVTDFPEIESLEEPARRSYI